VVDVDVSGDSGRRVHVFRCDKRHTSIVKLTDEDCTTPPLNLATLRVVVLAVQLLIDHGAAAAGKINAANVDKNAGMQLSAINEQTRTKATHKANAHY
jgi:hypothetical protein